MQPQRAGEPAARSQLPGTEGSQPGSWLEEKAEVTMMQSKNIYVLGAGVRHEVGSPCAGGRSEA